MTEQASNRLAKDQSGSQNASTAAGETIAFDDQVLVQRSRSGDMRAYGILVTKYQDRVFNLIYRMIGRRADAEELTQDTFLRAMQRLEQFRGQSKFYTWLFRIAVNLTISHRRRAGRVRFHPLGGTDDFDAGLADVVTSPLSRRRHGRPDSHVEAADTHRAVMKALDELDDDFRVAVLLRDVEEMDYAMIADVLNVPIGTVKSRLHRARAVLKDKLSHLLD